MERFTVDDLWKVMPNKYKAIVIASKEARNIAREARDKGEKLPLKPTILALERLIKGEIKWRLVKKTKVRKVVISEGPAGRNR